MSLPTVLCQRITKMPQHRFLKGHIPSKETKRKISETLKSKGIKPPGHIRHFQTLETRDKISKNNARYWLGKRRTEETKEKMYRYPKGNIPWNKGKEFTQIKGENNSNWRGGITSVYFKIRGSLKNKEWRSKVFERDNWTCQTCRRRGCYLEAHHSKKRFADILRDNKILSLEQAEKCEELWKLENGVTLCLDCHNLTKGRYGNN